MKKLILKTLCAWGVALVPCLVVQAANLLTNPGFVPSNPGSYPDYTASAPPGWSNLGPANGPMALGLISTLTSASVSPMPAYNGSAFMYDLGGYANPNPNPGDGITQTFATRPGHHYRLTFGHNAEAAGSKVFETGTDSLRVQVGGVEQTFTSPYDRNTAGYGQACCAWQGAWVQRSLDFTAGTASATLAFTVATVSNNSYGSANVTRNSANSQIIAMPVVEEIIFPPSITAVKVLTGSGRINSTDQFTVSIQQAGVVRNDTTNSTTQGSGSAVSNGTGTTGTFTATANIPYTLNEAGSGGANAAQYNASLTCSNAMADSTTVLPTSLKQAFTPQGNDVITCTISNAPAPASLVVTQKALVTAPATFNPPVKFSYTGNNGWTPQQISSPVVNAVTRGFAQNLAALNAATSLAVAVPSAETGWNIVSIRCTDTNAALSGNPPPPTVLASSTTNTVTVPANYVVANAALQCAVIGSRLQ